MAMGVNVVKFNDKTILDLRNATATPATVMRGYTAYGADGNLIIGEAESTMRLELQVPLLVSGWNSEGQQTIAIDGMTTTATVFAGGDLGSEPEYSDCGVYCSAQSAGKLIFTAVFQPVEDLVANVVVFQ